MFRLIGRRLSARRNHINVATRQADIVQLTVRKLCKGGARYTRVVPGSDRSDNRADQVQSAEAGVRAGRIKRGHVHFPLHAARRLRFCLRRDDR